MTQSSKPATGREAASDAAAGTTGRTALRRIADETESALCVLSGGEALELPLASVREVLRRLPITRMPYGPGSLLGLSNLRGTVLPVFSLHALRGGTLATEGAPSPAERIVVVASGSSQVGVLVDAVAQDGMADARRIDPATLLPASAVRAARTPIAGHPAAASGADRSKPDAKPAVALLGFRVGDQAFALPLDAVRSVAALDTLDASSAVVPRADAALPVLDAAALLGLDRAGPSTRATGAETTSCRLVIVGGDDRIAALAVDALIGILRVPAETIEPLPSLLRTRVGGPAIDGLCRRPGGRQLLQLLHPGRLLHQGGMQQNAGGGSDEEATTMADALAGEQFLLVRAGRGRFGVPLASVVQVMRHPGTLARLPLADDTIEGVASLRGRALPVIDGRRRFQGPENAACGSSAGRGRIVVITTGARQLGLSVDCTSDIVCFPSWSISTAPGNGAEAILFDRVASPDEGDTVPLLAPAALLASLRPDRAAGLASPERIPTELKAASSP